MSTLHAVTRLCSLECSDRVLSVSRIAFDLIMFDVFGSILAGSTIVLPDPDEGPNPDHWLDLLQRENITIWNSTPGLFSTLLEACERRKSRLPTLRSILLSGEETPR